MLKNYKLKAICLCLFAVMFLGSSAHLMAQSQVVKGVVNSGADGEPLPGVTVLLKGTSTGTVTDLDGNYTLNLRDTSDPVLVYSFIGYVTQEAVVGGRSVIDIALDEDVTALEEVVVVGYGVQQKKLVTGATGQVKGDKLTNLSSTDALNAMQGQVAGVNIAATSGQPGESMKVTIRGVGTIGNSGPLYIVDGIQTGDISYLNNSDIASIDVLKDAASAAIYGSQAANGVVLITTKTGKAGKAQWTFDSYYGIQEPANQIRMLNSQEYATIMNEAAINSGKVPYFSSDSIANMGSGTDWIDEMIYNNAVTQNYALGVSGGNETSTYSMSGAYTGQEGIIGGPDVSSYERFSFRVNSDHKFFKDIVTVGQHLTFSYMKKNGISVGNQYNNSMRAAYNTSPFLPMYDDNGDYLNNSTSSMYQGQAWDPWFPGESNPYASMMLNNQNDNNNQKMLGDFYVEIEPIEGLKLRSRFGYDYYASEDRSYSPEYELSIYAQRTYDAASQSMSKGLALTWDNTLSYDFEVGEHAVTVMGGTYAWINNGTWMNVSNSDLTISDLDHAYIDNTTNTDLTRLSYGGAPNDEDKLQSYFGRLSYAYKDKYLLNATFRADGSSKFAPENRWGYFPSVSAGWVLSGENFWSPVENVVSFMKLRASWGQVGNQNIDAFQFLAPVDIGQSNYYFGSADFDAAGNSVGAYPSRLSNTNLKWEVSEQMDFGFDAYLLDTRLEVNLDWYKKTTKDWLLVKPVYATAGADAPFFNGGNVTNQGLELALTWSDQIGEVNYFISANGAKNKNEVSEVPTDDGIVHGLTNMLYDNATEFYRRAESGYPIGYFWGYETAGVFQNEGEVQAHTASNGDVIQPAAQPGDLIYKDLNDDGKIDDADKDMVGDPNPDFTYSLSLGFDYKGFDFSVLAYGVAGNQIVQSYRNQPNTYSNYTRAILDRWHGEGTSNSTPRVTESNINYQFSDIFVQDGDFLRINNITLGYDFAKLIDNPAIGKLRLYASVLNAYTFTAYDGMDPEVGYGLENGSSGVDLGYYPRPRTYLLGLNFNF
ncbi:SusC/RagA family TonB-linked outer membrane protein [Reichenbachiella sp. 5M10]|uniref:SusC/RagA family TonB-linked outer membrane protein n=1 Tax=Reichenbachiella sp. 5M10 TaxID=1889772 RepID=UPI000C14E562|nr:TonB-dependent receptor [Reichenbachiella sp. 5M10]PIB35766.1 SusC/RagA family TonB-linked outer membrane protein [Reichenbachiella sp. 5M10]